MLKSYLGFNSDFKKNKKLKDRSGKLAKQQLYLA